ncbi:E3 ubiquitin-protein ligase RNF5 [Zea mays]|uniref:E3 ubiquitin-protein ligase RMA n=1 Tax=Zea mays TaxID=4577 RepID=A0A3L6D6A6_MAIZE|nr:E3 ubiquitin-protein ligase RNF5 [Zea mays]
MAAANVGESTSGGGSSSGADAGGGFECNICFELPQEPIVTLCGHLFCWPCLYKWLRIHSHSPECPVCKAVVEEEKLVPLYGRGKDRVDPRSKNVPGAADIPALPGARVPDATAYGQPAGFPYGYGHGHAFHGGHAGAHAHAAAAAPRHAQHQQQQADVYLKALLILVGVLVIASLVTF